jgi:hypothetical protein
MISNLIYKNRKPSLVQLDPVTPERAGGVIGPGKLTRYIYTIWAQEGIILEFVILELHVFCLINDLIIR